MSTLDEVEVTEFFAKKLGHELGVEFISENNEVQDSDTDTYIVDSAGNRTPIQNVTSEGQILKGAKINSRAVLDGGPFISGQVNHLLWVSDILIKKDKKNYSDASNLVILIRASMPTYKATQMQKIFSGMDGSDTFAGVYYVSMPTSISQLGYVVAIKKYWGTKDIF